MDNRKVKQEQKRLYALLDRAGVPQQQRDALVVVVDNLALLQVKLEESRPELEAAPLTVEYNNGGGQTGTRENPLFKCYISLWKAYLSGLDMFTEFLPTDLQDEAGGDNLSVLAQVVEMKRKGMA